MQVVLSEIDTRAMADGAAPPAANACDAWDAFYCSKTDPRAMADRVAKGMHCGVSAVIGACVVLAEAYGLFAGDAEALAEFVQGLINKGVIPKRAGRLGSV